MQSALKSMPKSMQCTPSSHLAPATLHTLSTQRPILSQPLQALIHQRRISLHTLDCVCATAQSRDGLRVQRASDVSMLTVRWCGHKGTLCQAAGYAAPRLKWTLDLATLDPGPWPM